MGILCFAFGVSRDSDFCHLFLSINEEGQSRFYVNEKGSAWPSLQGCSQSKINGQWRFTRFQT